jgi:hypothetical protein
MVVVGKGGIYSPNHYSSRWHTPLSMGTPDSPVVHQTLHCSQSVRTTSAVRWGLELFTIKVFYPYGALDRPVPPNVADCLLTSDALDCGRSPTVDCWRSRLLHQGLTRQFGGTPDSPMIFSGRAS